MKKTLLVLAVTVLTVAASSTVASAGNYSSRRCIRNSYYRAPVYRPVYTYRYVPSYRPIVVSRPYWHRHYYRGRYVPCHFDGGHHRFDRYHRSRTGFHVGVSIFR